MIDDITDAQRCVFDLIDGRQRPAQSVDLHLLAGIASGLMARASHDVGAPHEAMTQARAAYVCADNASHDGLRSWARALQSLISYWAGDLDQSLRYADDGVRFAGRASGSAVVWAAVGRARSLAALGRIDEARAAVEHASDLRDAVSHDELDQFGGVCAFSHPRQLYYSADALAWCGEGEAGRTEQLALDALDTYDRAPAEVRAFGDEAGARCALAIARIRLGETEGAEEAMAPVLALPSSQRINGIMTAVTHVHSELTPRSAVERGASALIESIRVFRNEPLALPR